MILLSTLVVVLLLLLANSWRALGQKPDASAAADITRSPQWRRHRFRNQQPLKNFMWRSLWDSLRSGRFKVPKDRLAIAPNDGSVYASPPETGLRLTWLGHSNLLIEIDGKTLLIDPLWGPRASPFRWLGPKRWYDSPLHINNLPHIDAVLISHDHYDHLCRDTIEQLAGRVTRFITPLGVGAHLAYWGVAKEHISELDWWQSYQLDNVEVTATPARHASGRHLFDQNKTLWAGFAMTGPRHNLFYSGDSGLFEGFKDIGHKLGPFDIAMIETGAYSRNWPDWHMGPEQAVIANEWLGGKQLLPLHWGLYNLSVHNWTEPMERVQAAAATRNLKVLTPRPGDTFEPATARLGKWWPDIPWQTAADNPIASHLINLDKHELDLVFGVNDAQQDNAAK